jgi:hypothetical protein
VSGDNGTAAVVGDLVSGVAAGIVGARAAAEGEQLPMFEVPTRHTGAHAEALQRALEHKRSRGRPPGAVNKSTKEFREWLLKRGVHPLQTMMQWALHSPTSLAAELGCTRLEAFDRLVALHEALAPYFASKMVPVDDEGRPVPFMMMQFGNFGAAPSAGGQAPWRYLDSEQNQALAPPQGPVSHGDVSHGTAK